MAWKSARSLEEVRSEFLSLWAENKKSVSQLCREYGISRKTAYKWRKRKENGGSMKDASRRPKRFPNATPEAVVKKVIEVRKDHPTLGGMKISIMLKRKGMEGVPAGSTVTEILRRHDLLNPRAVAEATHIKRFAKTRPNEMWQADFKGHFTLETGRRCHPLNIIDDCSRYAICSTPLFGETFAEVKPVFISAFRRNGLPETILCDNGNPWGTPQKNGITVFEVWAMELDVLVMHGRPVHPQTQGKEESFNKTWTRECLERLGSNPNYLDVLSESEIYRCFYNEERPHSGIGNKVPADVYTKSERPYPELTLPWEYSRDVIVRRVNDNGCMNFHGELHYVGEGLRHKDVGIDISHAHHDCINLLFRNFRVGRINLSTKRVEQLRVYRVSGDPRFAEETV